MERCIIKLLEINKESLSFDDILLTPKFSAIKTRKDVNLRSRLYRDVYLDIPIISANMDTVTEFPMLQAMNNFGGIGICHRFMSPEEHLQIFKDFHNTCDYLDDAFIVSVGVKDEDLKRIELILNWARKCETEDRIGVCIDVAHGHHILMKEMIEKVRNSFGNIPIIAGNVCTYIAAKHLIVAGVDAIKIGVGPGSACQTRTVTGCGVGQLTAIMEVARACNQFSERPAVIADGGIRNSGDIVKCLAAGADTVMMGSLLAGTNETPGEIVEYNGRKYKKYRGMASSGAMKKIGRENTTPEGVEGLVPLKGSVKSVIDDLVGGIRSGLSYLGVDSISSLHKSNIQATKITQNGYNESVPHMTLNSENII